MDTNFSSADLSNLAPVGAITPVLTEPIEAVTPAPDAPRPVAKTERIQTVDLIRGLALLGILLMNIPGFGFPNTRYSLVLNNPHSADYYALGTIFVAFDGTMRGLFSMLFGAGMVLFTSNKRELIGGPPVIDFYYRRLLWLVLFGVFNAYVLLWFGDILYFYGLCGMLLYPFRKTKPGYLVLLTLLCFGINHFKSQLNWDETRQKRADYLVAVSAEKAHKKLTPKQKEAKSAWEGIEKRMKYDEKQDAKILKEVRGNYGSVFKHWLPENSGGESWGMYHGCWDMLAMMFLGMALLSWGFFSNKLSTQTYAITLLVGYGVGLPLGWFYFNNGLVAYFQNIGKTLDEYRVPLFAVYDFRRAFLAIGHASLLLLIYRSGVIPWLMKALTSVGQMAFTNYLMQSIICTLFFYGYGLSYYGKLSYYQLYYVVAAVWAFQLILSPIWLAYFRFGPFEWLWRSLTYWQRQPFRIADR